MTNVFTPTYSDSYLAFVKSQVPGTSSGSAPPGVDVQPQVLLAQWVADDAGAITLDTSIGVPVVSAWTDRLNGYVLTPPALSQAPQWVASATMASGRPAVSFDGIDNWLSMDSGLLSKIRNLTGLSMTFVMAAASPPSNTLQRAVYIQAGATGTPRFGYGLSSFSNQQFYHDGVTVDGDPYGYVTGGTPDYYGWGVHTVRRDYFNAMANVNWNGIGEIYQATFGTPIYASGSAPAIGRIGAGLNGSDPANLHVYAIKLYTYSLSNTEVLADSTWGNGRIAA